VLFCLIAYLLWNLVRESQARFLLPAVLLVIILVAQVLNSLPCGLPRAAAAAVLALAACGNMLYHATRLDNGRAFQYLVRMPLLRPANPDPSIPDPRAEFYSQNLGALGDVMKEANKRLGWEPRTRILLLYEARPYLFAGRTIYNTVFDASELLRLARGAKSGQEIVRKLNAAGITYMLVNREELRRFVDQYARPVQLERLGIRNVMEEFAKIETPEDLYPPFYLSPDWPEMRQPVLEFLKLTRDAALSRAGRAPAEVYLAPLW
jgi:hypothetical protein